MNKSDQFGAGLFCFAFGAVVGSCIAMLYAPQSGRRTRRKLLRTAEEMQDRAVDKGREISERGRELYERGAKFAEHAVGR
ncbi:MAG: YtxH domain-containing protein [Bryobacterales bacterium]